MPDIRRYDLLERIASGGMGEVFLGRAVGTAGFEKRIAIKRILPDRAGDADFEIRFIAEAKTAVSLTHANIVQVLDLGRFGGELLLAMEYVSGADLRRVLQASAQAQQHPPMAVIAYLGIEALKGLAFAHQSDGLRRAIIHCDVSPSNLLLSYAGEVKIADFGVALALDIARRRGSDRIIGKYGYMAPEQLRGEGFDARVDLYALGVVLYEALTLERPFAGAGTEEIIDAVMTRSPPRLESLRPDVPESFAKLIERSMARDAKSRPASAQEMLAELNRIARVLDPITPAEVAAWLKRLVPPADSVPIDEQPARHTRSQTVASGPQSFVTRAGGDGLTIWERVSPTRRPRRPRTRRNALLAFGALLTAALAGGIYFGATRRPPAPTPPARVATPAPQPAPAPVREPPVVVAKAPPNERRHAHVPSRSAKAPRPPVPEGSGQVTIYAEPWATVFVDGRRRGITPLVELTLPAGTHALRLENPGGPPHESQFVIVPGKTRTIDVSMHVPEP